VKINSQKDFVSGILFTVAGLGFGWGATHYPIGTAARMGPGYFPLGIGGLMALVGLVIAIRSVGGETRDGERIGPIAWWPLSFIIAANLVFGLLLGGFPNIGLPAMGLIAGIYGVILVAALAGEGFRLKETLLLATVLAVGSYLAFVLGLNLNFQVWPTFITG
jgi:hypothetical protein